MTGCVDDTLVAAVLTGALNPKQSALVQQHLASCSNCRHRLSQAAAAVEGSSIASRAALQPTQGPIRDSTHTATVTLGEPQPELAAEGELASTRALSPGTTVDQYLVLRRLGAGGMGEVYLARCTKLDRLVALKFVHGHLINTQHAVERFLFEARATARFNHPHIVAIYGVGEHAGRPYVVLEYLEGVSLRERLRNGPLTPDEALRVGRAIAEALHEAHARGILHRDLKPANVMLCADGRVRVLDFGLSSAMDAGELRAAESIRAAESNSATDGGSVGSMQGKEGESRVLLTATGAIFGTPGYMAPEQWLAEPIGPATDVWALGAVLYEVLTGCQVRQPGSLMEVRAQALTDTPVDPNPLRRVLPSSTAKLVLDCLERDPSHRPTASTLAARLMGRLPSARRRKVRMTVTAGLLLVALGGLGFAALRRYRGMKAQLHMPPGMVVESSKGDGPDERIVAESERVATVTRQESTRPLSSFGSDRRAAGAKKTGRHTHLRAAERRSVIPGTVIIQSHSAETLVWVEVFVDGEYRGHTPLKLSDISPGLHRIEVKRDGYRPLIRQVLVRAGQTVRVPFALERR